MNSNDQDKSKRDGNTRGLQISGGSNISSNKIENSRKRSTATQQHMQQAPTPMITNNSAAPDVSFNIGQQPQQLQHILSQAQLLQQHALQMQHLTQQQGNPFLAAAGSVPGFQPQPTFPPNHLYSNPQSLNLSQQQVLDALTQLLQQRLQENQASQQGGNFLQHLLSLQQQQPQPNLFPQPHSQSQMQENQGFRGMNAPSTDSQVPASNSASGSSVASQQTPAVTTSSSDNQPRKEGSSSSQEDTSDDKATSSDQGGSSSEPPSESAPAVSKSKKTPSEKHDSPQEDEGEAYDDSYDDDADGGVDSDDVQNIKGQGDTHKIPCRARGMPMEHNPLTAFFVVRNNIGHGEDVICSHPGCRNAGVKFKWCSFCGAPVAKRNFNRRHKHSGEKPKGSFNKSTESASVGKRSRQKDDLLEKRPSSSKKARSREKDPDIPESIANRQADESPSSEETDTTSGSGSDRHQQNAMISQEMFKSFDAPRREAWISLLGQRPDSNDRRAMSVWVRKVLVVSDTQQPLSKLDDISVSTEEEEERQSSEGSS